MTLSQAQKDSKNGPNTNTNTEKSTILLHSAKNGTILPKSGKVKVGLMVDVDLINQVKQIALDLHGQLWRSYAGTFNEIIRLGLISFNRKQQQTTNTTSFGPKHRGDVIVKLEQIQSIIKKRRKDVLTTTFYLTEIQTIINEVTNNADTRTQGKYLKTVTKGCKEITNGIFELRPFLFTNFHERKHHKSYGSKKMESYF